MAAEIPRRIAMHTLVGGDGDNRKVAVFELTDAGEVTLEVLDESGADLAKQWFHDGIVSTMGVTGPARDNPRSFMRALMGPHNMSYYSFRAEDD